MEGFGVVGSYLPVVGAIPGLVDLSAMDCMFSLNVFGANREFGPGGNTSFGDQCLF